MIGLHNVVAADNQPPIQSLIKYPCTSQVACASQRASSLHLGQHSTACAPLVLLLSTAPPGRSNRSNRINGSGESASSWKRAAHNVIATSRAASICARRRFRDLPERRGLRKSDFLSIAVILPGGS